MRTSPGTPRILEVIGATMHYHVIEAIYVRDHVVSLRFRDGTRKTPRIVRYFESAFEGFG